MIHRVPFVEYTKVENGSWSPSPKGYGGLKTEQEKGVFFKSRRKVGIPTEASGLTSREAQRKKGVFVVRAWLFYKNVL